MSLQSFPAVIECAIFSRFKYDVGKSFTSFMKSSALKLFSSSQDQSKDNESQDLLTARMFARFVCENKSRTLNIKHVCLSLRKQLNRELLIRAENRQQRRL